MRQTFLLKRSGTTTHEGAEFNDGAVALRSVGTKPVTTGHTSITAMKSALGTSYTVVQDDQVMDGGALSG